MLKVRGIKVPRKQNPRVTTLLLGRIKSENERGRGYVLPKSYNVSWPRHMNLFVQNNQVQIVRSKSKKNGAWMVAQNNAQ